MKEMKSPYPYTPERKVQIRETDDLIRTQIVYTRQRINTEDLPGSLLAGDLYMLLQFCTKRDRLDYKAMPLTRLREMTDDWENESYYWSADTRAQAEDEVVQLLDGLDVIIALRHAEPIQGPAVPDRSHMLSIRRD